MGPTKVYIASNLHGIVENTGARRDLKPLSYSFSHMASASLNMPTVCPSAGEATRPPNKLLLKTNNPIW